MSVILSAVNWILSAVNLILAAILICRLLHLVRLRRPQERKDRNERARDHF